MTPIKGDPEIENHPVIKAAKTLLSVHQEQIDLIQNHKAQFFKTNPGTGEKEDVTAQVLGEHVSNVNKAEELINRVRTEKVFTAPDVNIIRELDLPMSEKLEQPHAPKSDEQVLLEKKQMERGIHAAQTQGVREERARLMEAEKADVDPASVVHLPGELER